MFVKSTLKEVCGKCQEVWHWTVMFEAIALIQTKKVARFPIILVGTEFLVRTGLLDKSFSED
jgi:hypothetical protein